MPQLVNRSDHFPKSTNIGTLAAYPSAFGSPPALIADGPGGNKDAGFLRSYYYPLQDFQPQPQPLGYSTYQSTAAPDVSGINAGNWESYVRAEIERRNLLNGGPIPRHTMVAIIDAYRQLAGLPPASYSLDSEGAAILNYYYPQSIGGVVLDSFNPTNISDNLTSVLDSIADAGSTVVGEVGKNIGLIQITIFAAIAVGVMGAFAYFKN